MRKRKIPQNMPRLDYMPEPVDPPKWNVATVLKLVTRDYESYTPEELELITAIILLIRKRLDPDDYDTIFRLLSNHSIIVTFPDSSPARRPKSSRPPRRDKAEVSASGLSSSALSSPGLSSPEDNQPDPEEPDLPFSFDP